MTGTAGYRGLDKATLDREYSPSSCVRDLRPYLEWYAGGSAEARRCHRVLTGLRYGDRPAETLDFFPASQPAAPLHVFVHGGYWQELSKNESSFMAPGFLAVGAAFAAIGYGLAPAHRLDEIIDMVRTALRWLVGNAVALGADPRRIHVSGSSAGAHLVAMALLPGDVRDAVAGVTLLSGVYDLQPLVYTYINDNLGLTREAALRNSPLFHLPERVPPVVLARGGIETSEFIRQHEQMAVALAGRTTVVEVVSPTRDHFNLPCDLADPGTALGRAVLGQMRPARAEGVCGERR
ncbi:MAG: alpha/beta hydrolase [Pseudonocardiaceae bacterium]